MKSRFNGIDKKQNKYLAISSIKHALQGLSFAFKTEPNLSLQFLIGIFFAIFDFATNQWILSVANLIFMSLVMSLEIVNTVVENICDIIDPEYNPKIKLIKDLSAGAVLVAALVWLIIIGGGVLRFALKYFWKLEY
jgi:diacylglycerol kinase (ATP)